MQAYYRTHMGKNPKAIIVKVAHKMIKDMLSVIKNEKPYRVNYSLPGKQKVIA
jgi:transposase